MDESRHLNLIRDLGYESGVFVRDSVNRRIYKVCKGGRYSALKIFLAEDEEKIPNDVLIHSDVLRGIPKSHRRLVIPSYEHHGFAPGLGHYVVTDWLDGRDFNDRWDEWKPDIAGGRSIQHDTINIFVELIEDLMGIPAEDLVAIGLSKRDPESTEELINECLGVAIDDGTLSSDQCKQATRIAQPLLEGFHEGRLMLSNADFQLRNFVEISPTQTGLVDWDTACASNFELENCVAYQWILMWNNPPWQRSLLREARARFEIERTKFRGILMVRALIQAMTTWRKSGDIRQHQIDYLIGTLDDEAFELMWGS